MSTLVANVTILRKGPDGPSSRSVNASMAWGSWRDPIVVSPGESFIETDAAEVTRLVSMGAARLQ